MNLIATANLIKALESSKAADIFATQIEKSQAECSELGTLLAREGLLTPLLDYKHVNFFLSRFIGGDTTNIEYHRAVIDIFVQKIYLFDDKTVILLNADNGVKI